MKLLEEEFADQEKETQKEASVQAPQPHYIAQKIKKTNTAVASTNTALTNVIKEKDAKIAAILMEPISMEE